MPTPVSSSSTSVALHPETPVDGAPPDAAPVVTIPPVYIEGDAGGGDPGVKQLVKGHDAAATPNCREQGASAAVGTIPMGAGVLATLAGAASGPLGLAAGLLTLFGASVYEGKDLRSYYDCKTQ
jgi:hypothetical protein